MQFEFGRPRPALDLDQMKSDDGVLYFFNRKSETSVFYSFTSYKPYTNKQATNDKNFVNLFKVPEFC